MGSVDIPFLGIHLTEWSNWENVILFEAGERYQTASHLPMQSAILTGGRGYQCERIQGRKKELVNKEKKPGCRVLAFAGPLSVNSRPAKTRLSQKKNGLSSGPQETKGYRSETLRGNSGN